MAEALKIQKMKMMMTLHKAHNGVEFDSDELNSNTDTGMVCAFTICLLKYCVKGSLFNVQSVAVALQ